MKPAYCYLLLTCLIPVIASAQSGPSSLTGPGIAFQADYLPAAHYIRPEDSIKTASTTATRRYSFGAAFDLRKRVDTASGKFRSWGLGVEASYMQFSNKQYEKTILPDELFGAGIALRHYRSINRKWSVMGVLAAGVYTDLEAIDGNDIFLNGGVIFINQLNRRFSYGFGAVLSNTFGTPMVLPAVLVKWTPAGKFNVQVAIPEGISASYRVNGFLETGLGLRLNGNSYDVESRVSSKRLMGYREMTLGLENTFHLTKHVSFSLSGGYALLRSADYRHKRLSEMFSTQPEHRLAANWFASAGFRVNFKP
ncbi:hypothetical protein EGT74_25865 [Chitinophaga lutea]|uniref:DUF6268 domain-containing protein n=1 Tax=Chitinophaga lutea TaxID=2488634 RepID=A0A3N4Q1Z3_9BACT|nr:DUF6268 family outer membrane beta-barrel protein [Chitinophaga lutea]RPE05794.1 hypothetical protein EGT74_25865 [Chitinophaga lutea]